MKRLAAQTEQHIAMTSVLIEVLRTTPPSSFENVKTTPHHPRTTPPTDFPADTNRIKARGLNRNRGAAPIMLFCHTAGSVSGDSIHSASRWGTNACEQEDHTKSMSTAT